MEIWLCRHGECLAEENKIIQGHIDGELTETGYTQSRLLGNRLQYAKFTEIISSDLNRAKQTAKEILQFKSDTNIEFDGRLREKACGVFENKTMIQYKSEAIKKGSNLREFRPAAGESWVDLLDRAREVMNDLIVKYVKKDYIDKTEDIITRTVSQILQKDTMKLKSDPNPNSNSNNKKKIIDQKVMRLNTMNQMKNPNLKMNIKSNINNNFLKKTNTVNYEITLEKGKEYDQEMQNIITKKQTETPQLELDYMNLELDKLLSDDDYQRRMSKIYRGYDPDLNFNRVLLVTHPGFIMEFLNSIRIRKGIRIKFVNDSKPASLYIIRVYCENCGSVCYSKDQTCKIDYDVILYNNTEHLQF